MSHSDSASASTNTVFDKIAGKAKEVVGNVIGDETLAEEGELQQQKAETAKRAVALSAEAAQREAEAALKAEVVENRVEQQRVSSQIAEREREQQLERERQAAEAAIAREAAQREIANDRKHANEARVLDIKEDDVVVDLIDGVTEAAEIEREAKQAEAAADALELAQRKLEQR